MYNYALFHWLNKLNILSSECCVYKRSSRPRNRKASHVSCWSSTKCFSRRKWNLLTLSLQRRLVTDKNSPVYRNRGSQNPLSAFYFLPKASRNYARIKSEKEFYLAFQKLSISQYKGGGRRTHAHYSMNALHFWINLMILW